MIIVGFSLAKSIIKNSTYNHLEELAILKSTEVELSLDILEEKLIEYSTDQKITDAANDFKQAFESLEDDKYEIFYADSLEKVKESLENLYSLKISSMEPVTGEKIIKYLPENPKSLVLQHLFINLNKKEFGSKDEYTVTTEYYSYGLAHETYHTFFRTIVKELGAKDLYLTDPASGDIFYSVAKNIDFGTNLYDGPYKMSGLSSAFRQAAASEDPKVFFSDYTQHEAAFDEPSAFFSVPVFFFNEIVTVVVLRFDASLLDNVLNSYDELAGEASQEYILVGKDMKLRNNPKGYLANPEQFTLRYMKRLSRKDRKNLGYLYNINNLATHLKFPNDSRSKIISQENTYLIDYKGDKVMASSVRVNILGKEFYLVAKINRGEVTGHYLKQSKLFIVFLILVLIINFFISRIFSKSVTMRINELHDAMNLLNSGRRAGALKTGAPDELGKTVEAYNKLRSRVNDVAAFAIEMSEGNYNHKFEILNENDSTGKSLNALKEKMINSKEEHDQRVKEDEIRNWLNTGIAKFNDLLRQNNDDIKALTYILIENLVEYIDANIGGLFLVEGEKEEDKKIKLMAAYAFDRRKYLEKTIEIGEGLIGNCYLEKKSIYLKKIPEDYIEITSGLGHSNPNCLYIVPLKVDESVIGMIEIGAIREFEEHHIEFMEKVSESIAATLISVQLNMKTAMLLEESNRKAEEIAQQEEEMRQNLEEMQATQEELARLRQDDEKRSRDMQLIVDNTRKMLKNILDSIPGGYVLKDSNGIIHLANAKGAEYYGQSVDKIAGKNDHELLSKKLYDLEHKKDLATIDSGEQSYKESIELKGKTKKYEVIKKPFFIDEIHQMGILTIRKEIKK